MTWVGTGESIWWRGRNLKIWIDCTGGESTESERVDLSHVTQTFNQLLIDCCRRGGGFMYLCETIKKLNSKFS